VTSGAWDLALIVALAALAATLLAAVVRPRLLPEALVVSAGALLLVAAGAASVGDGREAVAGLGSTVGFLAALLVLAEGCPREGIFDAIGSLLAVRSRGSARRLLALVFAVAAIVTAILSLDATVVLLTPVVFVTACRMRTSPKPHVYACSHLANSASLPVPVSNLTNLLALHASRPPWPDRARGRGRCPARRPARARARRRARARGPEEHRPRGALRARPRHLPRPPRLTRERGRPRGMASRPRAFATQGT
jgi:citrate transporter